MGYDGHAQAFDDKHLTNFTFDCLTSVKAALDKAEVQVPLYSGAGSGNYYTALGLGMINEIQGGGGVFNCKTYMDSNETVGAPPMQPALFLQTQIVSVAGKKAGRLVGDAGFKSGFPMGQLPIVHSHSSHLEVTALNAEHTIFKVREGAEEARGLPKLGERVTLIPAYSDATMLLHSHVYAARKGIVESVWSLEGSIGRLQ